MAKKTSARPHRPAPRSARATRATRRVAGQPLVRIPAGNVVVGQSGGPTVVINQSLAGVIETLRGRPGIDRILGCVHGYAGIKRDQYIELQDVPQERLERIAQTPSSALGSSRDKPKADDCQNIVDSFRRRNVRYFFYIGGNDSSDTCRIVNELAAKAGYELRAFHVPKTIDNDLVENDHTPGYASAAKFVAQAFIGDNLDNRALPGIKINVVMGRHAGFLTAASVMARQNEGDGPHLIYVPEVPFAIEKFLADVQATYRQFGRCLIAASEGIHDGVKTPDFPEGKPIAVSLAERYNLPVERDQHGNIQLSGTGVLGDFLSQSIKIELGPKFVDEKGRSTLRVRADTLGYMQRSFAGCVSPVDAEEARQAGRAAAQLALAGHDNGSISIQRISTNPYKAEFKRIELATVAGQTRTLDQRFILNGNDIDERFKDYLRPLVGPLPVVELLRLR